VYEELRLKELKLQSPEKPESPLKQDYEDIMMRNIVGAKCMKVVTKTKASAPAVASKGAFTNMSEKERYLKAMGEFNHLHSMI